jgi:Uncharacterized conserved protein
MKHAHTGFRSVLALTLLGAVAAVCFSLGMWQLGRASERDALHNAIERGRLQAPVELQSDTRPTELSAWRPAVAQGRWSQGHTVLLENRNLDGLPGYWVATPLLFDARTAAKQAYEGVLVLRGWVPRDMASPSAVPTLPFESGPVRIRGELHAHVPRIFELWSWAGGKRSHLPQKLAASGTYPQVQNLELAEFSTASGLTLMPAVLAQTQDTIFLEADTAQRSPTHAASALRRDWPGPSLDSDQNRGYALQWFSFSAIAAFAALYVLYGMFRGSARRGRHKEAP